MKNKHSPIILAGTLALAVPLLAEQPAPAQDSPGKPEPAIKAVSAEELAHRKASIPKIEEHLKDREQELSFIVKDIERLSQHMESRIEKIVSTLESMKDSQNSKIRVAKMKQDAMKGLYKSIEDYRRRSATLKEELRSGRPSAGQEATNKGIVKLDEIIEKRAEQLVSLSKSFTEHVDYKKYEQDSSNYGYNTHNRWGWGWDNSRVSEKWKQNRRETTFTDKQRKHMIQALKSSIDELKQRNNTLRNKSREANTSEATKQFYTEDIARNEAAIKKRSAQLAEILNPSKDAPNTHSVNRNQAHDTELMLREIANDIERDKRAITRNYSELKQRLKSYNQAKTNLQARKQWLERYEQQHGKTAE